jgi:hypothetical protein
MKAPVPTDISSGSMGMGVSGSARLSAPFSEDSAMFQSDEMMAEEAPITPDTPDKKVIKNGNLQLRVDSVDKAAGEIASVARDNDGDIFSSNIYQSGRNIKTGYVTVKVPVANFEKTYTDLKKIATLVVRESTSASDVTREYTDFQAQLKNKQAEEQAYLKIMGQAQKVSDILEVQQQLSSVQGEIEQLQGQIKYLDSQTDMAEISVGLTEDASVTVTEGWRPFQVAKEALSSLVQKAQNFIDFVIRLVITAIPVLILYGLLVWAIYWIGKKVYFKVKSKNDSEVK